jgi:hypothetical protein
MKKEVKERMRVRRNENGKRRKMRERREINMEHHNIKRKTKRREQSYTGRINRI